MGGHASARIVHVRKGEPGTRYSELKGAEAGAARWAPEKQGGQRGLHQGVDEARERRKDLPKEGFVGSGEGCWDPSPATPPVPEYQVFLPLNLSVLIYKTGDSADVQLGSQQNRELGPSLLRPVWRASDFRERQMGSLAGSPHSSPPRRTRLPCSRPCRTKGQAAVEARECESGGWPLDKGQFRGPGEVGSDRSWQLRGQSVS